MERAINVSLLGMGNVGAAVAAALLTTPGYGQRIGAPLRLRRVLVRDSARQRSPRLPDTQVSTRAESVLEDDETDIVVELMGGEEPAYSYIKKALSLRKHVVTANKEVMAKHGEELRTLAHARGVSLRYEASVGGGIPLIAVLQRDLLANEISQVTAIINGTTNYILTRMANDGIGFAEALAQAQELGYAEADPKNDVEGIDAAYKIAILAGLAFHTTVQPGDVYHEGITRLQARDFRYADELGYAVKLLAIAQRTAEGISARVHPALIQHDEPLAKVDGVFNAVQIEGDLLGPVMLQGRGAGPAPTTSAVMADIIEIARSIAEGQTGGGRPAPERQLAMMPIEMLRTRYYLRMDVTDQPGVLARVAQLFGDNSISIASVIQKEVDASAGTAEIVIMTHQAMERSLREAVRQVEALDVVAEVGTVIRVLEKTP